MNTQSTIGGLDYHVIAAGATTNYPTGAGGNTTTAANSALKDAQLVLIQSIVIRTNATGVIDFKNHAGTTLFTITPTGQATTLHFGVHGLKLTSGYSVLMTAGTPPLVITYKRLL